MKRMGGHFLIDARARADGYLSQLINDAYVDRLYSLPVAYGAHFTSSATGDYVSQRRGRRRRHSSGRSDYSRTGSRRRYLKKRGVVIFLSLDNLDRASVFNGKLFMTSKRP